MGQVDSRPTYAEISLANLRFNFRSARDFIGHDVKYMAVVKADAYGHGAVECSRALVEAGVDWLGVALVEEALELRNVGIDLPILCLGSFFSGQEDLLLEHKITPVVIEPDQITALDAAASNAGRTIPVHIKIDTGMGRLGTRWDRLRTLVDALRSTTMLEVEGLMTHFASANDPNEDEFTSTQMDRFGETLAAFDNEGFRPTVTDMANSPAAVAHPRSRPQMVRLGGILYGLGRDVLAQNRPRPNLKPVMSLNSVVADLKQVPAGETLGYARTFTTTRDSLIALVPIGYHDGFRRGLSNKASVIINGTQAPVTGRISMDWTIVDVTDVPDPKIGGKVTVIGQQGSTIVSAEDLASLLDTISYEITCGISGRVPRIYVDDV